ncbi:MAG: hypothetical protein D6707_01115, partial [Bacteroidetes bacterium]
GIPLTFRVSQFKPPINNNPVAWVSTALKYYFKPYKIKSGLPEKAKIIATVNNHPAAYIMKFGKGEILVFCGGVVDWFNSPGLALRIDNWACGRKLNTQHKRSPELFLSLVTNNDILYAVGRRFANHNLLSKMSHGTVPKEADVSKKLKVKFPNAKHKMYTVKNLLNNRILGKYTGETLKNNGVTIKLKKAQAFLLKAE